MHTNTKALRRIFCAFCGRLCCCGLLCDRFELFFTFRCDGAFLRLALCGNFRQCSVFGRLDIVQRSGSRVTNKPDSLVALCRNLCQRTGFGVCNVFQRSVRCGVDASNLRVASSGDRLGLLPPGIFYGLYCTGLGFRNALERVSGGLLRLLLGS